MLHKQKIVLGRRAKAEVSRDRGCRQTIAGKMKKLAATREDPFNGCRGSCTKQSSQFTRPCELCEINAYLECSGNLTPSMKDLDKPCGCLPTTSTDPSHFRLAAANTRPARCDVCVMTLFWLQICTYSRRTCQE